MSGVLLALNVLKHEQVVGVFNLRVVALHLYHFLDHIEVSAFFGVIIRSLYFDNAMFHHHNLKDIVCFTLSNQVIDAIWELFFSEIFILDEFSEHFKDFICHNLVLIFSSNGNNFVGVMRGSVVDDIE